MSPDRESTRERSEMSAAGRTDGDRPVVAVDLGGTSVKTALVNSAGVVLGKRRVPTPKSGRSAVIDAIRQEVHSLVTGAGALWPVVGVGSPGMVDAHGYLHEAAVNIPGWSDFDLADEIESALGMPVVALNDANAAAMGEYTYGAGTATRAASSLALVTVGTGIGVGLVVAGSPYAGKNGAAGELGHLVIRPGGRRCVCGNRGCVESYASAAGVASQAREFAERFSDSESALAAWVRSEANSDTVSLEHIYRYLPDGDPLAAIVHAEACEALTHLCAVIASAFAPDRIVFSGGGMGSADFILPVIRERLPEFVLSHVYRSTTLSVATVGLDAGLIGSAAAARRSRR